MSVSSAFYFFKRKLHNTQSAVLKFCLYASHANARTNFQISANQVIIMRKFSPFHFAQRRDERRNATLLTLRISVRINASKYIFASVFRFALWCCFHERCVILYENLNCSYSSIFIRNKRILRSGRQVSKCCCRNVFYNNSFGVNYCVIFHVLGGVDELYLMSV